MGDPAGVGPEVIVGSWSDPEVMELADRLVIGRVEVLRRAVGLLGLPLSIQPVSGPQAAAGLPHDCIPVLEVGGPDLDHVPVGENSAAGGEVAKLAIERVTAMALAGAISGIVTAPISKKALHLAGHTRWPGHTEMLADLCGVAKTHMMLYLPPRCPLVRSPIGLGVIHTTLHVSLREAIGQLDQESILVTARQATRFARQMLAAAGEQREARVGVAALNPHAGEEGLFGDEEIRIIRPAVEQGIRAGLPLSGPLPCDTLMHRAADGEFDVVVAMVHDQGHIALKLLGLHHAVNVTLGLPVVRTSVAHGTAFDLAWQGRARSSSMSEAIRVAVSLARNRIGGTAAEDR